MDNERVPCRVLRQLLAAAVILVSGVRVAGAQADFHDAAIVQCRARTIEYMAAQYPQANGILWARYASANTSFERGTSVKGIGWFRELDRIGWRRFFYECAYKVQTRQTLMIVRLDSLVVARLDSLLVVLP